MKQTMYIEMFDEAIHFTRFLNAFVFSYISLIILYLGLRNASQDQLLLYGLLGILILFLGFVFYIKPYRSVQDDTTIDT